MPYMPYAKRYNKSLIVLDSQLGEFNQRCCTALKMNILAPATTTMPILGTCVLEKATSAPTYLSRIRSFVWFLLQNPQYDESLPLFYPHTPNVTVTCQETAVADFLISKFAEKGSELTDFQVSTDIIIFYCTILYCNHFLTNSPVLQLLQGNPILDKGGQPLKAMGGWNNPDTCDGLKSALSCVHANAHGLKGDYKEKCEQCFAIYKSSGSGGCIHHHADPRPARTGNVCTSTLVRDTVGTSRKTVSTKFQAHGPPHWTALCYFQ